MIRWPLHTDQLLLGSARKNTGVWMFFIFAFVHHSFLLVVLQTIVILSSNTRSNQQRGFWLGTGTDETNWLWRTWFDVAPVRLGWAAWHGLCMVPRHFGELHYITLQMRTLLLLIAKFIRKMLWRDLNGPPARPRCYHGNGFSDDLWKWNFRCQWRDRHRMLNSSMTILL